MNDYFDDLKVLLRIRIVIAAILIFALGIRYP